VPQLRQQAQCVVRLTRQVTPAAGVCCAGVGAGARAHLRLLRQLALQLRLPPLQRRQLGAQLLQARGGAARGRNRPREPPEEVAHRVVRTIRLLILILLPIVETEMHGGSNGRRSRRPCGRCCGSGQWRDRRLRRGVALQLCGCRLGACHGLHQRSVLLRRAVLRRCRRRPGGLCDCCSGGSPQPRRRCGDNYFCRRGRHGAPRSQLRHKHDRISLAAAGNGRCGPTLACAVAAGGTLQRLWRVVAIHLRPKPQRVKTPALHQPCHCATLKRARSATDGNRLGGGQGGALPEITCCRF
jgi:hypothetical protein